MTTNPVVALSSFWDPKRLESGEAAELQGQLPK